MYYFVNNRCYVMKELAQRMAVEHNSGMYDEVFRDELVRYARMMSFDEVRVVCPCTMPAYSAYGTILPLAEAGYRVASVNTCVNGQIMTIMSKDRGRDLDYIGYMDAYDECAFYVN